MKVLQVFSFRNAKENKLEHINLDINDSNYTINIRYINRVRTIISEKKFPGDDNYYISMVVENEFEAELISEEQFEIINKINSMSNPVLKITYDDSGLINKLVSIEYDEKTKDLIDIEKKLNIELDEQNGKDYMDYLDDFYNGV
jgi:hypothetical protein